MQLETRRLRLRPLKEDDLDFLAAMMGDQEVMRWYPKPLEREEAAEWIARSARHHAEYGYGALLMVERASGSPVGQAGILPSVIDGEPLPNLLWMVHRPFWRRGFATEAARAVVASAYEVLDLPRVVTVIRPENLPSHGVARKLGLQAVRETEYKGYRHVLYEAQHPSRSPAHFHPVTDLDAEQALARARERWVAAVTARSPDAYLEILTEDVVWIPPGQPAVHGHDGMRSWMTPFFERFEYDFTVEPVAVRVAGGWAVERGRFVSRLQEGDGEWMTHGGDYVALWRRAAAGTWKIERYVDVTGL